MTETEWWVATESEKMLNWLVICGPDINDEQTEALVRHGFWQRVEAEEVQGPIRYIPATPPFEAEQQARLLHDIFGPFPFRDIVADPAWLTSDVLLLARGIYDDKAFDRMPILADALQDAGCDNPDILSHCRSEGGEHVRGCWVIDLLLGRPWREPP